MLVQELWRYPVKSLAGEQVDEAFLTVEGFEGDRIVRAVSTSGRRITARQYPRLLGLAGSTAPDGTPLVDGLPWHDPVVAARVRAASADDVRLIADESRIRFDVLPVSLVTDGALQVLGLDRRRPGRRARAFSGVSAPRDHGKARSHAGSRGSPV